MEKLLQKFVQNEVIMDIKRKDKGFSESTYYQFVTEPSALNFVDDTPRREGTMDNEGLGTGEKDGLCIVNEYAFTQCTNTSFAKIKDFGMVNQMCVEPQTFCSEDCRLAPDQAAAVWKEMTLAR